MVSLTVWAGDALKAQRGILQLLLVGPLREVRVVVDDLSLQRFGDYNRVAHHELELASTCMTIKLTQAGCEITTKKSMVLSNSVSVRAKLQLRLPPPRCAGNAGRAEPRN